MNWAVAQTPGGLGESETRVLERLLMRGTQGRLPAPDLIAALREQIRFLSLRDVATWACLSWERDERAEPCLGFDAVTIGDHEALDWRDMCWPCRTFWFLVMAENTLAEAPAGAR